MPSKLAKANHSVEKSFQIIEEMAAERQPMRLQDIAQKTGIPSSTALRMLTTLMSLGYVSQDTATLRYYLSLKFAYLGNCVTSQLSIRDIAHPVLIALSKACGESVCLAQEQNREVVYIDISDGPDNMLKITQYIGKRAPLHCTGVGKIMLLNYTEDQIRGIAEEKGMQALTKNTITSLDTLIREVDAIRERGYALDDEECELGARCIAVGVTDYTGKIVAGISMSGPISRMTVKRIEEVSPLVIAAAKNISKQLASPDV